MIIGWHSSTGCASSSLVIWTTLGPNCSAWKRQSMAFLINTPWMVLWAEESGIALHAVTDFVMTQACLNHCIDGQQHGTRVRCVRELGVCMDYKGQQVRARIKDIPGQQSPHQSAWHWTHACSVDGNLTSPPDARLTWRGRTGDDKSKQCIKAPSGVSALTHVRLKYCVFDGWTWER